jgi:hypothetical protein
LQHLNVVEQVVAKAKILDKPGARFASIPKDLPLNIAGRTRLRF